MAETFGARPPPLPILGEGDRGGEGQVVFRRRFRSNTSVAPVPPRSGVAVVKARMRRPWGRSASQPGRRQHRPALCRMEPPAMNDLEASPALVPGPLQGVGHHVVGGFLRVPVEIHHVVDVVDAPEQAAQGLPAGVGPQGFDLLAEPLDAKTHRRTQVDLGRFLRHPFLEDRLRAILVRQGLDALHGALEEIVVVRHPSGT